ncbi:unnamed protein product [Rhizoctonia solani]|uniref:Uncharacterized protein n=1 Tax=Rhizoctonia solani TaxID=456999 RepID=A0A8H3AEC3_9AGAM|nr:unnamed protein product [Rhizoctonia solani]
MAVFSCIYELFCGVMGLHHPNTLNGTAMGLIEVTLLSLALSCLSLGSVISQNGPFHDFALGMDEAQFEHFVYAALPKYKLRIKSPTLCDPGVKQYSGYFNISEDKQLFFWSHLSLVSVWRNVRLVVWRQEMASLG